MRAPVVRVPVLSKAMVVHLTRASNTLPPWIKMPLHQNSPTVRHVTDFKRGDTAPCRLPTEQKSSSASHLLINKQLARKMIQWP